MSGQEFKQLSVHHSTRSGGMIGISFRFFDMKICFVFSLEPPYRGDSNDYAQYYFNIKKEKSPYSFTNLQLWDFSKELKNEFEIAVVNEPSVFEPRRAYCIKFVFSIMIGFRKFSKDIYCYPISIYKVLLLVSAWPRGYKTFFVLNSVEHEILNAHKHKKYQEIRHF